MLGLSPKGLGVALVHQKTQAKGDYSNNECNSHSISPYAQKT